MTMMHACADNDTSNTTAAHLQIHDSIAQHRHVLRAMPYINELTASCSRALLTASLCAPIRTMGATLPSGDWHEDASNSAKMTKNPTHCRAWRRRRGCCSFAKHRTQQATAC